MRKEGEADWKELKRTEDIKRGWKTGHKGGGGEEESRMGSVHMENRGDISGKVTQNEWKGQRKGKKTEKDGKEGSKRVVKSGLS